MRRLSELTFPPYIGGMIAPAAPLLFQPLKLKDLTLPNRVVVSPMCMYSAEGGVANEFHLVHLGQFALGGEAHHIAGRHGGIVDDDAGGKKQQQDAG